MTETVVLCGNFATIYQSHFLQFRLAVPIPVPVPELHRVYSHSRGIPVVEMGIPIPEADL